MDVLLAAYRKAVASPAIVAQVSSDTQSPWIFRGKLPFPIETTGGRALLICLRGSWTSPNRHNTAQFPRLHFQAYADPTRSLQPGPVSADAYSPVLDTLAAVSSIFHCPATAGFLWSTLRIVNSIQLDEPAPYEVPEGDGLVTASLSFAVTVG